MERHPEEKARNIHRHIFCHHLIRPVQIYRAAARLAPIIALQKAPAAGGRALVPGLVLGLVDPGLVPGLIIPGLVNSGLVPRLVPGRVSWEDPRVGPGEEEERKGESEESSGKERRGASAI